MSIDELINSGYVPNKILVQVDSEGYIIQQRGPELSYKLRPEDIDINFKNPSV